MIDRILDLMLARGLMANEADARAVILAMLHPTAGMVVDGFEAMTGDWKSCLDASNDAHRCWCAMITAALSTQSSALAALPSGEA